MAAAPVQLDEKSLILEKISELTLPAGVKFKRLELGSEWTGEPAWHIYFGMSKSKPYTKSRILEFIRIEQTLTERIFALQTGKFPFIHLLETR